MWTLFSSQSYRNLIHILKSTRWIFTKLTALVNFGSETNASDMGVKRVNVQGHRRNLFQTDASCDIMPSSLLCSTTKERTSHWFSCFLHWLLKCKPLRILSATRHTPKVYKRRANIPSTDSSSCQLQRRRIQKVVFAGIISGKSLSLRCKRWKSYRATAQSTADAVAATAVRLACVFSWRPIVWRRWRSYGDGKRPRSVTSNDVAVSGTERSRCDSMTRTWLTAAMSVLRIATHVQCRDQITVFGLVATTYSQHNHANTRRKNTNFTPVMGN